MFRMRRIRGGRGLGARETRKDIEYWMIIDSLHDSFFHRSIFNYETIIGLKPLQDYVNSDLY